MRIGFFAFTAVIILLFSSCMLLPKKNVKTEFLIPSESDIPGWIIADEIINKDSSNINEYNSAYADKGVIAYSKCRYRDIDNNEIYIDLNIIKMLLFK